MISLHNSALLLIEFQNEWLTKEGKLNQLFSDRDQFLISLKNAENVIQSARDSNIHIIHSGLNFTKQYKELGEARHGLRAAISKNKTFLENTHATQFTAPFDPKDNEFTVRGRIGGSAFSGSNLDAYLRNNRITTLFIMGYALHVCVESTLRAAHDLGYETIVIDDASGVFNQEQQHYFLQHIIHHFGSNMKSDDFIDLLKEDTLMVNNDDIEKIIQVVNMYFKGTYHGDADLLTKAFHPSARITGIINNEICDWSLTDFITRVTATPTAASKGDKYDKEIIAIDKTKNAAMAKARVVVADLIFFDYITLLKINGQWIIRNKSFTN